MLHAVGRQRLNASLGVVRNDLESCESMNLLATAGLFVTTAVAEIIGCYLPYLWLKDRAPVWVLFPAAVSLAVFVWLLTLHPTAAGRV